MSQTEELQGGIFAKHQTRRYCFAAHTAFVGVNNISQNDKKKIFLILQKFAVRGNE